MVLSELYRLEDLLSLVWLGQARGLTGWYRLVALLSLECKLKLLLGQARLVTGFCILSRGVEVAVAPVWLTLTARDRRCRSRN